MLKLETIRRQGTIAVLGRNVAVKVLIEKTARIESRDVAVNEVDDEGSATEAHRAPFEADILVANPAGVVRDLRTERDG